MFKRKSGIAPVVLRAAAAVFALAQCAGAATVTFTLALHDDGSGVFVPRDPLSGANMFAIYAEVSNDEVVPGLGPNGGLFGFGVDLVRNNDPAGNANLDFILNMSQRGEFRDAPGGTINPIKFVGFGAGVSEDAVAAKISGLPDLAKGVNLIPAYGFGQVSGDLSSLRPSAEYRPYLDTNGNGPGSVYNKRLLLGIGAWTGPGHIFDVSTPKWQTGSVDRATCRTRTRSCWRS